MSTPTLYESTLRGMGDNLAEWLTALWQQHERGALTLDEFVELAALLVVTANGQAAELARRSVAAFVAHETGTGIPPAITVELEPWRTDPERVQRALGTIAGGAAIAGRLSRLAHAEPIDAAAKTWETFIMTDTAHGVTGWRRQLDADPCELCTAWAGSGDVFPVSTGMLRHPGCACVQVPTFDTKGKP